MSQLLSPSTFPGDYSIELLMQLHTVRRAPQTLRFSASWLVFVFSPSIFCPAYHLSAFLSKDIHQRNMAPPSLVTPTALCQLSEPKSTDCCSCRRRRGGYRQHNEPARICLHPRCRFYLSASLNIQQTKRAPREFPLERLHYIE